MSAPAKPLPPGPLPPAKYDAAGRAPITFVGRRASPRAMVVGLAIVVAVVVVVGLTVTRVAPEGPSPPASGEPGTYSSAVGSANSLVGGVSNGPWALVAAVGVDLTNGISDAPIDPSCTLTGGPGQVSIPTTTGNYSSGQLSSWLLEYLNPTSSAFLLVEVDGTTTTEIGMGTGGSCLEAVAGSPTIPPNSWDSTQVANEMLGLTAVETFLHAYPSANVQMTLGTYEGGIWSATYSTCGIPGLSTTSPARGAAAVVEVAATSGKVLESVFNPKETCDVGGGTPIGSAFAAGDPFVSTCPAGDTASKNGCTAGDYVYTLSVESSSVELADVLFEVVTSSAAIDTLSAPGGFTLLDVNGTLVAQSTWSDTLAMVIPSDPWSTYGVGQSSSTPLTTLDSIVIDVGTADPIGTGLTFVVLGAGVYTGSTAPISLP